MPDLHLQDVDVHYGTSHILHDVSMRVGDGDSVAYLGGNGAGKTTTFKAIMNLVEVTNGTITYDSTDISTLPTYERINLGIAYVPSELQMFKQTVRENLLLAHRETSESFERRLESVYSLFPALKDKEDQDAGNLSGGQQRMVTIGRGLINEPDLILLDEPTEGLAPQPREKIVDSLVDINERGTSIVLVEHNLEVAYELCERAYVLNNGQIVFDGRIETIQEDPSIVTGIR